MFLPEIFSFCHSISESRISFIKETPAFEGLKLILEYIYGNVELIYHTVIDNEGVPEYDGNYDIFINSNEIHLTKEELKILFDFVCQNISVFIKTIIDNRP